MATATAAPDAVAQLTDRQREVYELARASLKPREIAERLNVTTNAINGHLSVLRSRGLLPKGSNGRGRSGRQQRARSNRQTAVASSNGERQPTEQPTADSGRSMLEGSISKDLGEYVPSLAKTVEEVDARMAVLDAERERLATIKRAALGGVVDEAPAAA